MAKKQNDKGVESKIKPLADRVLIKEIEKVEGGKTKSGIIIPETVDKDNGSKQGEVMAVGEGRYDDGILIPMKLKVGDRVLFQWGEKIVVDGEEYHVVNESNVLAVIN